MTKRALMLCYRVPFPLTDGYRLRAYHIGRCLATEYNVDLLCLSSEPTPPQALQHLESVFHRVVVFPVSPGISRARALLALPTALPLQVPYHFSRRVRTWVVRHAAQYDLVFASHLRMAQYIVEVPCRKVVDLIDAMSLFYEEASRYATGAWRLIYRIENSRLARYEAVILNACDKAVIASEHDARYVIANSHPPGEVPRGRLVVVPNGVREALLVDPPGAQRHGMEEDWIVFLGKMDYAPNVDAVITFCRTTWPELRARNPSLRFVVVGGSPRRSVRTLQEVPGVEITGYVKDPFYYVKRAKVVVVPLRFGAGIQNKILEAMALGKPVVTTPVGARGIEGEDGEHFVVSDLGSLGERVQALLCDRPRRERLGAQAQSLIRSKYSWKSIGERLLDEIC